jgi:hypothetical protein
LSPLSSNRVNANCGSTAAQAFPYDPFGNINKSGSPYSFQPGYSSATNRMTSIGSFTPTYDANGNVLNNSNRAYTWDTSGHPVTIDSVSLTVDKAHNEIVVLDTQTNPGKFHGHVRQWSELTSDMQNGPKKRRTCRCARKYQIMTPKFDEPTPISREQVEDALASDSPASAAEALIRMALWETDPRWAEQKSLSALRDTRKEVRMAALLAIGHLARLHRSLSLEIVVPAVRILLDDPECCGTAENVLEDIAIFMPKGTGGRLF